MQIGKILTAAGATVLIVSGGVGAYQFFKDGLPTMDASADQSEAEIASPWSVERTLDKLTNQGVVSAKRKIDSTGHLFDVSIICRNGEELTYDFTVFDTKHEAATLRSWDRELSDWAIRFQARVDQQSPIGGYVINPRFSNELLITTDTAGINSFDMSKGKKLVIRLAPGGGEDTLEIDQTDKNVQAVLNACGIVAGRVDDATEPESSPASEAVMAATAYDMSDKKLVSAFAAATGRSSMFTIETEDGFPAYVTPRKLLNFPFGPVLLVNVTMKTPSHVTYGGIRIYYLNRDGNRFTSSGLFEEIASGQFGVPAENITITNKLTSYPAIYLEDGYGPQGGYSWGWVNIVELRPEGPAKSDTIPTYYSNDGAINDGEKAIILDGKITNARKGESFDIVDEKAGIREHYIRSGTKFVRSGGGESKFAPE